MTVRARHVITSILAALLTSAPTPTPATTTASSSIVTSSAMVSSGLASPSTSEVSLLALLRLADLVDDFVWYSQVFDLVALSATAQLAIEAKDLGKTHVVALDVDLW